MKSLTLPWSGKLYKGRAPRWRYSRSVGGNGTCPGSFPLPLYARAVVEHREREVKR